MGHFATGVSIVTTHDGTRPWGITVNALSSISLEPPLVMVALDHRRDIVPAVRSAGRYAVCILGEDQRALSECFAGAAVEPDRDAFCGAGWQPGRAGMPLLDGAIANLECTVVQEIPVGDHLLFIGRVDDLGSAGGARRPLLWFRRRYLRIELASVADLDEAPEA
jgi:3-hydroxy-9,10-secoandrosta-1,3,5(10)-triene-9,17-dione monooxygenase reductase component